MPTINRLREDHLKPESLNRLRLKVHLWLFCDRITRPIHTIGRVLARLFTVYRVAFLLVVIAAWRYVVYRISWLG
jgi:hypothetical protein